MNHEFSASWRQQYHLYFFRTLLLQFDALFHVFPAERQNFQLVRVYESHIHIMWIIELWRIGNPSSFRLMQSWSKREKCAKQEIPWLTGWMRSESGSSVCARVFFSCLLVYFFITASNERVEWKKGWRLFSAVRVISRSTVFLSLFGNRNQFTRANGCSRGSIYKSVSHPFIKIKARPKRQERRQPMRKLHQTKVYETNDREGARKKTKKKKNQTQTDQPSIGEK